ncbi:MAG: hypothetical protein FWB80_09220 [Defluviitaleaceae bacterium]|nr:hypothetical protein [Defluviitaleaceae bacterium]
MDNMNNENNFNIQIGSFVVKDVAEKVGAFLGPVGKYAGKAVDALTKKVTIKLWDK